MRIRARWWWWCRAAARFWRRLDRIVRPPGPRHPVVRRLLLPGVDVQPRRRRSVTPPATTTVAVLSQFHLLPLPIRRLESADVAAQIHEAEPRRIPRPAAERLRLPPRQITEGMIRTAATVEQQGRRVVGIPAETTPLARATKRLRSTAPVVLSPPLATPHLLHCVLAQFPRALRGHYRRQAPLRGRE